MSYAGGEGARESTEDPHQSWLSLFILALLVSGVTAFPLVWEVTTLQAWLGSGSTAGTTWPELARWISTVPAGLTDAQAQYPFLFYGTDWLASAHIVIASAFWGPLRDPIRNVWVVEFGVFGIIPLWLVRCDITRLIAQTAGRAP